MSPAAENAIILHIGVHKTGSTALQAALAAARPELKRRGILYPGTDDAHHAAAWAVTGFTMGFGDEATSVRPRNWSTLVKQARRHKGRVVISSEFFGRMRPAAVRRVVDELGADRVHVVFAVRRLSDLLPSSWQQYLKTGFSVTYRDWLKDVLRNRSPTTTKGFWYRADFAALVQRWSKVVPPEQITAVILDPADRDLLFRATEDLLALPSGWLDPYRAAGRNNRSMTAPEAEVIRRLNELARDRIGWKDYSERVRHGAIRAIVEGRNPPPDEARITTPKWALLKALRRQKRDHRRITGSGIHVVGDPGYLLTRPRAQAITSVEVVPVDIAALGIGAAAGMSPVVDVAPRAT